MGEGSGLISWAEDLPVNCPPNDAIEPDGPYYRLADTYPPANEDFLSHFSLFPKRNYTGRECKAKSLSVFSTMEACENARKATPVLRKKLTIRITLSPGCGVVKPESPPDDHFFWWKYLAFDPIPHCTKS